MPRAPNWHRAWRSGRSRPSRASGSKRVSTHCARASSNGALDEAALKTALRRLRVDVFCTVMERDLRGAADVAEVTGAMTDLAEVTIQRALAVLTADLETLFGEPRGPNGERLTLGVVGMGKLGGRELNASSDIDLIFVYEDDGETAGGTRAPLATQEFFTRLGRRLIGALAEITQDGYVFRVDMRLRPNGDSGPLVCSLGMLEEYFTCRAASGSATRGSRRGSCPSAKASPRNGSRSSSTRSPRRSSTAAISITA